MKAIITNYRYYVLAVLSLVLIICLFGVPADDLPFANWLYTPVSSKLIALGAGFLISKLYKRWEAKGTIPELINSINNY